MRSTIKLDPVAEFSQRLAASLEEESFVGLALSGATQSEEVPERVLGRLIELKGEPHLSFTLRYQTRDETRNLPTSRAVAWVERRLGSLFHSALLRTTKSDWQLVVPSGKRARLVRHKPSTSLPPTRQHDRPRQLILEDSARDWLAGLGIADSGGGIRPAMADKYSQINRFLEIFSHLAKDAGWIGGAPAPGAGGEEWTIADMGCGKGYLTFGLWQLCRRQWDLPVRVIGVEARSDLVVQTNKLAVAIGAKDLRFMGGDIRSIVLPGVRALIALHACDTATDDAIRRGIELGAQLIVVAPCCHKAVRPELRHPGLLAPVLRHGLMEERMAEWVTDGLRALFLQWAGYRSKVFEFVSSEHTPKNLMIAAVRERAPFEDREVRQQIQELKGFFGIEHHALDPLLTEAAGRECPSR